MKKRRLILIVLGLMVLIVLGFFVRTMYLAGEFREVAPFSNWDCRLIPVPLGSEDITVDQRTGMAFLSAADFRSQDAGGQPARGAIYGLDLTGDRIEPKELTAEFKGAFTPHGIGFYRGPDGAARLFVVNHTPSGHFVEIFDYDGDRLVHRRTVSGPLMHSPNDVIPVGPESFYVTNDHGAVSKSGRMLEDYLQLPKAYVLYFDGERFHRAAEGMKYANGINLSPDGRYVYVAETVGRKLRVYERDEASGGLNLKDTHDMGTGVDNIEVDPAGILWIGAHPKLLTFVKYSKDPSRRAPSQVLKVQVVPGGGVVSVTEYQSLGDPLSAASVAAPYEDLLLIGSVFDDGFLICE